MTPAEQLAAAMRDQAARLRRIPPRCLRDGIALVEWLSDEAKALDRGAGLLAPRDQPARIVVPETRFTTGTIAGPKGRMVRVEIRNRKVA